MFVSLGKVKFYRPIDTPMASDATTVWLDRPTHKRLLETKAKLGTATLGATIRALLDTPQESATSIYARRKKWVDAACRKHGIRKLVAFGSRARGDAKPGSDLDLCIDLPADKGLFEFMHAQQALAQAFACPVDVIEFVPHRPRLMAEVKRDGVTLYGR